MSSSYQIQHQPVCPSCTYTEHNEIGNYTGPFGEVSSVKCKQCNHEFEFLVNADATYELLIIATRDRCIEPYKHRREPVTYVHTTYFIESARHIATLLAMNCFDEDRLIDTLNGMDNFESNLDEISWS